ncbi:expressed unknown protein [Seminavis robusta]|uniref:Uncharacterized protein n=1 Tax=Seminavis robusta TaxID=568900 RepID=A0A9N8EDT2_9STRA|nr:expressed unknown protein [Seminavis robusta]|eukprot:Sro799_g204070.1 n/a (2272) ;mRNA; r:3488-10790
MDAYHHDPLLDHDPDNEDELEGPNQAPYSVAGQHHHGFSGGAYYHGGHPHPHVHYGSGAPTHGNLDYAYAAGGYSIDPRMHHPHHQHHPYQSGPRPNAAGPYTYATQPEPPSIATDAQSSSNRCTNLDLLLQASATAQPMPTSNGGSQSEGGGPGLLSYMSGHDSHFGPETHTRMGMATGVPVHYPHPGHPPPPPPPPYPGQNPSGFIPSHAGSDARKRPAPAPLVAPPSSSGGIFDDAESEGGHKPPLQRTEPSLPVKKKAKVASSSKGGIFDDADEDESFDAPTYPPRLGISGDLAAAKESQGQTNKPSGQNPKVRKSAKKKSSKSKKGEVKQKDIPVDDKDKEPDKDKKKKKKPTKPTKRVLVAKKEKDQALKIVEPIDDLMGILVSHHCRFLAKKCWIFSIQQLDSVLQSTNPPADSNEQKESSSLRSQLLLQVAQSSLVSSATKGTKKADTLSEGNRQNNGDVGKNPAGLQNEDTGTVAGASSPTEIHHTKGVSSSNPPQESGRSNGKVEVDSKAKAEAERLLRAWEERINAWKQRDPKERRLPMEKKFPLDGPVSCLFPTVALRFFASVPLRSLFDFMSIKKTETGAIIALCGAWRKACGLTEGAPLALAKHFLGLGLRVETAISSVPPTDPATRKWMKDIVVVLTGAAREFVVDSRKISSGAEFIETRTKDLATALVEWRTTKGLPPLKGSGKVAMISGWKANVKEALDLEEGKGKILKDIDLQALVEAAENTPIVQDEEGEKQAKASAKQEAAKQASAKHASAKQTPSKQTAPKESKETRDSKEPKEVKKQGQALAKKTKQPEQKKQTQTPSKQTGSQNAAKQGKTPPTKQKKEREKKMQGMVSPKPVQASNPLQQASTSEKRIQDVDEAHSTKFFEGVLDPKHISILQHAGVTTAAELFAAQRNPGSPLVITLSTILPDKKSYELVISDWCQMVSKKLNEKLPAKSKKRKGNPPSGSVAEEKAQAPAAKKAKKEKRKENQPEGKPQDKTKDPAKEKAVTTFLSSLGITSAEAFMHSRTTDLSAAFVEWRAKHNMSVLKGLGAIASVSGWKAQVRKMAKERGLEELAQAGPGGPSQVTPSTVQTKTKEEPKVKATTKKPTPQVKPEAKPPGSKTSSKAIIKMSSKKVLSFPEILFGKPTKKLVVESSRDPRLRFYFQLSIRKKPSGIGLFICFLGARKLQTVYRDYARVVQPHVAVIESGDDYSFVSMPVAKDLSKKIKKDPNSPNAAGKQIRVPFSTQEDGCGMLELCAHDVWPLPCEGEVERVFPIIKSFLLQVCGESSEVTYASNVTVGKDENGKCQYFLYLKDPLERGQSVEVRFCSPLGKAKKVNAPRATKWRQRVEEMILRLSRFGLQSLVQRIACFVSDEVDGDLQKIPDKEASDAKTAQNDVPIPNLIVARRRAHWVTSKIVQRLQEMKTKGGSARSVGAEAVAAWKTVAWTPELVSKLQNHRIWDESTVDLIKKETYGELDDAIESNDLLNASSLQRLCPLGMDLFQALVEKVNRYSTSLDASYPEEVFIADIRELCVEFARAVTDAKGESRKGLEKLLLKFQGKGDFRLDTSPSRTLVFRNSISQGYTDALALCNEPVFGIMPPDVQRVIATSEVSAPPAPPLPTTPPPQSTEGTEASAPTQKSGSAPSKETAKSPPKESPQAQFRVLDDVKRDISSVNEGWYIKCQMMKVLEAVMSCSSLLLETGVPLKASVLKEARDAVAKVVSEETIALGESCKPDFEGSSVAFPCVVSASEYTPKSLPLFLGLVWPNLRISHWRVEGGETPSDVAFLPPGQRSRKDKEDRQAKETVKDRAKSRIKLAKASSQLGLGLVPKLTKRLFVNAVEEKPRSSTSGNQTVSAALAMFLEKATSEISEDNTEGKNRAELVVDFVKASFDQMYPLLLSDEEKKTEEGIADGRRPSDFAGCEYLSQFLLVVPGIMSQAQLSVQLIDDTTMVLKELANFLTQKHTELFDARFHPPKEDYVGERAVPSSFSSCLENLRSTADSSQSLECTEAFWEEDRPEVTDFLATVMSQVVPCRATAEDVAKKNRRIGVGFVGLMCRHCSGAKEGRYFFTSIESMTTAATVIEKHIQKCEKISQDIKDRMKESRGRHAEQRKTLAPGAQAAYFLRLWERLRSSKVRDAAASLQMLEMTEKQDNENEDGPAGLEFDSHIRLIDYLRNAPPWNEKPEVLEGVRRYYDCLEHGGKTYGTFEMPKNFNSEWLLTQPCAKAPPTETTAAPTSASASAGTPTPDKSKKTSSGKKKTGNSTAAPK